MIMNKNKIDNTIIIIINIIIIDIRWLPLSLHTYPILHAMDEERWIVLDKWGTSLVLVNC